jgi:hypothetical protein
MDLLSDLKITPGVTTLNKAKLTIAALFSSLSSAKE